MMPTSCMMPWRIANAKTAAERRNRILDPSTPAQNLACPQRNFTVKDQGFTPTVKERSEASLEPHRHFMRAV